MATIAGYEKSEGKRYRVRYRKPDHSQINKEDWSIVVPELILEQVSIHVEEKSLNDHVPSVPEPGRCCATARSGVAGSTARFSAEAFRG